jgi:hypothetical protein
LIKDFKSFISEAITVNRSTGGGHYLERVDTRLANLKIIGFTDSSGKKIAVSEEELNSIQSFYRTALSKIANPEESKIFSDLEIKPGHIGIVRLGKPKVTLSSGEIVEPVFEVYERTDSSTGKPVLRTGKCFWLFTIGSQVSTIKLYNVDGNSQSEKQFLINKSIEHMTLDREAELAKISRVFSIKLDSPEALAKRHTIVLTPAGVSIIGLNLNSESDINTQLDSFLSDSLNRKEEKVMFIPNIDDDAGVNLEMVPKQMNITPGKVWLLEKNDKFNTWGALPIIQSKQVKGAVGNEIQIKVGKKWLHWLDKPTFNTPIQIDRTIKKGDTITLGKELGNGDWIVNTGKVTDIATDSRSIEYPYVKTNGWDSTDIINRVDAEKIFNEYRENNESVYSLLDFNSFINL